MDCLEENLDVLTEDCKKAVREYVEKVDEDPGMDEIFARSCAPFWDKHCMVCTVTASCSCDLAHIRDYIHLCVPTFMNKFSYVSFLHPYCKTRAQQLLRWASVWPQ